MLRFYVGVFLCRMVGVWLFLHGFFLTRTEISTQNGCYTMPLTSMQEASSNESHYRIYTGDEEGLVLEVPTAIIKQWTHFMPLKQGKCWSTPAYSKVLVLIIDALRYDFLKWQDQPTAPFHNHVRMLHLLYEWNEKARERKNCCADGICQRVS